MTSPGLPLVSVVVPAEHAEGSVERCLASISGVRYPPARYEVLVVGERARDLDRLGARYGARPVVETRKGAAFARNAGIEACRGEIVAFTDADCAVSTMWLRELVQPFADDGVGAVAGAILPYPPTTDTERYAAERLSHSQLRPLAHTERPFALMPNLAFRRAVFDEVGMFDPLFPGGGWEDADLCWRLARSTALSLSYASRAIVFHRYRSTPRAFLAQHYRYGYGLALLVGKYRDELPEPWLRGPAAGSRLSSLAREWVRASARSRTAGTEPTRAMLDLLRVLGQRAGYLHGSVAARVRRRAA